MQSEQQLVEELAQRIRQYIDGDGRCMSEPVPVGVSSRHVHLSREDLACLFGPGYELEKLKELSQPGQFAAKETLTVAGPKGSIAKVRVLGPVRSESQVELSRTDSVILGVNPPVRESGSHDGAVDMCLIGPAGSIVLKGKTIVAQRHIHMTPEEALKYGVYNGQTVIVHTGGIRGISFTNVLIRVSPQFSLEMHIDTDEANAAGIRQGDVAVIVQGEESYG